MPARRVKKRKRRAVTKKGDKKVPYFYIVAALFFLAAFLYIRFSRDVWDGQRKVVVTYPTSGGNIAVTTFDPIVGEIIQLTIPGDTQVEVARSLGQLRLKNVWQLGENEGLSGLLLANTLTDYFNFPTYLWGGSGFENLTSSAIIDKVRFVVYPGKTNVGLADRLGLALFSVGVSNAKNTTINLIDTGMLKEVVLADGNRGYILTSFKPSGVMAIFASYAFSDGATRVAIKNGTGSGLSANKVGEVMQVLGAKVVAVDDTQVDTDGCAVLAKKTRRAKEIASYFSCSTGELTESGFDLEIIIGRDFGAGF